MPTRTVATSKCNAHLSKFRFCRYPFLSLEIFNCEVNPLLEKFFEAPEPKQAADETTNDDAEDEVNLDDKETSEPADAEEVPSKDEAKTAETQESAASETPEADSDKKDASQEVTETADSTPAEE